MIILLYLYKILFSICSISTFPFNTLINLTLDNFRLLLLLKNLLICLEMWNVFPTCLRLIILPLHPQLMSLICIHVYITERVQRASGSGTCRSARARRRSCSTDSLLRARSQTHSAQTDRVRAAADASSASTSRSQTFNVYFVQGDSFKAPSCARGTTTWRASYSSTPSTRFSSLPFLRILVLR